MEAAVLTVCSRGLQPTSTQQKEVAAQARPKCADVPGEASDRQADSPQRPPMERRFPPRLRTETSLSLSQSTNFRDPSEGRVEASPVPGSWPKTLGAHGDKSVSCLLISDSLVESMGRGRSGQ